MATMQRERRKPSRMSLSRDVARLPRSSEAFRERARPSPFAGMNQTEARLGGRVMVKPRDVPRPAVGARGAPESTENPRRAKTKDEKPLFHALKMQATLTPLAYSQRMAVKEKLALITSFEQFNLLPDVQNAVYTHALEGMTDVVPTPAQKLAIPALLSRKGEHERRKTKDGDRPQYSQFLIAAETGSGKTLAYLLPVVDAIKRQEIIEKAEEEARKAGEDKEKAENQKKNIFALDPPELSNPPHSTMARPRAIILLPSSELVTQVGGVVKLLSHTIKYRSAPISAIHTPNRIRNRLYDPKGIDIIVSTPHLISSIAEKDPNILSRVTHLVIDEADSLLDRSFAPTTSAIIDRVAPSLKQLILCSATIPRSLDSFLDKRFPTIKRLVTPKLHSISRRVQLGVVDIEKDPYRGNRNLACADVIWTIGKAVHDDTESTHTVKSMLVFVNEREKAVEVTQYLASKGIDAVALTRDTTEQRQAEVLSAFTSASRIEGEEKPSATDRSKRNFRDFIPFDQNSIITTLSSPNAAPSRPTRHLPNTKVLVTTDLGSRGIDTLAVRHVILYDVPHTTIDFVHRLGRMGRMGRRGRGIVLTGKHDRKDVVAEVKNAMFKGQALI
ncbi:ATP-dependent RNA helicase mrh4 [Endocarpon pusillum Z07020]|uniref:RNA helicase n=1 Tax=Endocarpon pusillum (strain Z07020 / HMAS-L-300199) TaxID=1263415 RepID=U1HMW3_ENDPU|nr:ATP-dependent RNA helicase mrh4 [Endocarpon pusillum Z07020]ERF70374.1 ATP-dependent RNA helicase mrh4 [Endocarpon pusillum Z07020]